MRFYEGWTYNFKTAVRPVGDYYYEVLSVPTPDGKQGYVRFGFERSFKIGAASRIMIHRKINNKWKARLYKIPFVRENGRLVFDLPEYLKKNGLRYKLYKRYDLYDNDCLASHNPKIFCKNGIIEWGSEEYYGIKNWIDAKYEPNSSCMKIHGKKVDWIGIKNESNETSTTEIIDYFRKTMEESQILSYYEFGMILDKLKLHKENSFLTIKFTNGASVAGNEIDWNDDRK